MGDLFRRSLFGYRRDDVEQYIKDVLSAHQTLMQQKETVQKQLEQQVATLESKVEELTGVISRYQEQEHALSQVWVEAHKRASSIEDEARERAEELRKQVNQEILAAQGELNSLRGQIQQYKEEFTRLLESYLQSIQNFGTNTGKIITPAFRMNSGNPESGVSNG